MTSLPHVDYQYPERAASHGLIAIIGEAPGADEVKQGRPFIGRSGQLLDKNLQAAGIDRTQCFVGNAFRYQPPQNKVAHFFISGRQAKETGEGVAEKWGRYASRYCRAAFAPELEHLQKTLRKLQPAIIITLGATSMWALTGREGITALHGQPQPCRMLDNVQVIPAYHPSYILRGNWSVEPDFLADLVKARELTSFVLKKTA